MKNLSLTTSLLVLATESCRAFMVVQPTSQKTPLAQPAFGSKSLPSTTTATQLHSAVVSLDSITDVCYTTSVSKPLGVVFGENPSPMYGLVVDDVELGSPGGAAGLRAGDQLVAVSGQAVVGLDFDTVMDTLRSAQDPMELQLYRGSAKSLFTILANRDGFLADGSGSDDDEEVVMDENYESPVNVGDLEEYTKDSEEPLSVGEIFNAFKKIGQNLKGPESDSSETKKSGGGGLFGGMFGESIQLDGNDAKTDGKNL